MTSTFGGLAERANEKDGLATLERGEGNAQVFGHFEHGDDIKRLRGECRLLGVRASVQKIKIFFLFRIKHLQGGGAKRAGWAKLFWFENAHDKKS